MTNEEMLGVADIVERATNRFNAQAALIASMKADHEAKMVEHRAAFGARTEADAKIIAGLRSEIDAARMAVLERDSLISERDGLLTQVQDMRAEMERLRAEVAFLKIRDREYEKALDLCDKEEQTPAECIAALQERLRASIARGDFAQMEVAALKSRTPTQHGRWVRATSEKCMHAKAGEVVSVRGYLVRTNSGEFLWEGKDCEPCDPPATHDTEAGKAAAESAVRTEPVAEPIKVGDVAKVVGASGDLTAQSDIGKIGEVLKIDFEDGTVLLSGGAGWVNHRDVRKVTT